MDKVREGEQTLIGLFLPQFQPKIKEMIAGWKAVMSEQSKIINPEDLVRIEFCFTSRKKLVVYRDLARAVNEGWLKVSMIDLAKHLAMYTNLAVNEDMAIRIHTIYHFLKDYKKKFTSNRRLNGRFVTTASKRYLPPTSTPGAGGGDDSVVRVA